MTRGTTLRIETLSGDSDRSAFEQVREQMDLYAGVPPEPVAPETECLIAWRGGQARARCSLTTASELRHAPGRTGMIGHYEALDHESGVALLRHGCDVLAGRGVDRVIGPINGGTWARYRLALPSEPDDPAFDPPHFASEPRNPFDYPEHFAAAGFEIVSRYESRIDTSPDDASPDADRFAERVASAGIRIRPFDLERFDAELETLHTLSLASFKDNPFYAPLDIHRFRLMYEPLRPIIDPNLVFIAEDARSKAVAFLFAFIDPTTRETRHGNRVIFKTIASLPEVQGRGLGAHLFDRLRVSTVQRGGRAIVHALMHSDNTSLRLSARHRTHLFRRYALYQWIR